MNKIFAEDVNNEVENLEYIEPEKWRDIEGYDYYKVSSNGRIKSLKGRSPRILKKWDVRGYKYIRLCKNGESKPMRLCRIVGKAFVPNPGNKPEINHINGIKDDDRAVNLEWCTSKENKQHASDNGLLNPPTGEDNASSKLTREEVIEIKKLYKETDLNQYQLAEMYSVNQSQISRCTSGQTWYDIT